MYGETQMLCNSLGQSVLMQLITRQKFSTFTGCENSKSYKTQILCVHKLQPPTPNSTSTQTPITLERIFYQKPINQTSCSCPSTYV